MFETDLFLSHLTESNEHFKFYRYLNGYELSGELPDISSMDALEIM